MNIEITSITNCMLKINLTVLNTNLQERLHWSQGLSAMLPIWSMKVSILAYESLISGMLNHCTFQLTALTTLAAENLACIMLFVFSEEQLTPSRAIILQSRHVLLKWQVRKYSSIEGISSSIQQYSREITVSNNLSHISKQLEEKIIIFPTQRKTFELMNIQVIMI